MRASGIWPIADSADQKRKITGSRVRAGKVVKGKDPPYINNHPTFGRMILMQTGLKNKDTVGKQRAKAKALQGVQNSTQKGGCCC